MNAAAGRGGREAGLARSAGILGLGNVLSRVVGLAREAVISGYFGASGELSAFRLAARALNMLYDLLVGGMLSAALVPVFSQYTEPDRRVELAHVASTVLSLLTVVLGGVVVLIEIFAGPLAALLGDFDDPELQATLARLLRVIAPAVLLFGLSGGVTGLLYSLRRFSYTAFSSALFNLGIVIAAPLLSPYLGINALPLGSVAGSLMWLLAMAPGVRDLRLRFTTGWRHPAVRRILRLYLPIALGLMVTQVQIVVDGRWASAAGEQSVSWMGYATTLIQLPLGLVPTAVSLAALPSLARLAAAGDWDGFRSIFARGMRLVLILLIPAAAGLWVLAEPAIRLLFEHGQFIEFDTVMTAQALRLYLLGLLFAGVDFLLNYTFYARQDTRTPAIVGVVAVGLYLLSAAALKGPLGFLGLVLADSIKQAGHALIMIVLMLRTVGGLRNERILATLARSGAAAIVMGVAVFWVARLLERLVPAGTLGEILVVVAAGGAGGALYIACLYFLRVPEAVQLAAVLGRRAKRFRKTQRGE